jgi:hypothetical protein
MPRNRPGYEQGQAVEAAVRSVVLGQANRSPFARPLMAKQVNAMLPAELQRSERHIRRCLAKLRRD